MEEEKSKSTSQKSLSREDPPKESRIIINQNLVEKYELFVNLVNPSQRVIYHPCGAYDISPSIAFPKSRVIYVELDEKAVEVLQREGFEAHYASALEFDPGDVDVLIMLNPQISPLIPASYVIEGGYALVNDYHSTATELRENPDFTLCGLIRETDKAIIYDTENPEDYWKEIETEEEFRNAPFNWSAIHYLMASNIVKKITGKEDNILNEYKKIIEMAREQKKEENLKLIKEQPELADTIQDPDKQDIFLFNHNGQQFVIFTKLPRKKGTADSLFVFKRISNTLPYKK